MDNVKSKAGYVLIYDLGGGSTEVSLARNAKNPEILFTISIPWGARNSSEAFGLSAYDEENADRRVARYTVG